MSGKGAFRLAVLVFTALLGAGLTLGAVTGFRFAPPQQQEAPQR
jgi:hypothetical protein